MSDESMRVAALQMVSGSRVDANLRKAEQLLQLAADKGAALVVLPEFFCLMGHKNSDKLALAEPYGQGPLQAWCLNMAKRFNVWLVAGTMPLRSAEPSRVYNSCLVFRPDGECVLRYNKIHLFDYQGLDQQYRESDTLLPGKAPAVFDTPWGRIGVAICYDLRFPELFRAVPVCDAWVVPAAFTHETGRPHWQILLQARAIENQCYLVASAQGGRHENGRRTWGHSQIVGPWGDRLAQRPSGAGVVLAELSKARIKAVRNALPALQHRVLV